MVSFNASIAALSTNITILKDNDIYIARENYTMFLKIIFPLGFMVSIVGIIGNFLNFRTFLIMGLKDGVTLSFFALSIADFLSCFSYFIITPSYLFQTLENQGIVWFYLDPFAIITIAGNVLLMCTYISMLITAFIAVARCVCVAIPLKFKLFFTTGKTLLSVVIFSVIVTATYSVHFAYIGVQLKFYPTKNASRIGLWVSPNRRQVKDVLWLIFETIAPMNVEVILLVCMAVMIYHLRKSASFRTKSSTSFITSQDNNQTPSSTTTTDAGHKEVKFSPRELRAIYQVIIICFIYIVNSLPKVVNVVLTFFEPNYDNFMPWHYIYIMVNNSRGLFEALNASCNFFVYYKCNTTFREKCFGAKTKT